MRYPILSNWITYKKIPGTQSYSVKNHIFDEENVISVDEMRFAKRLDGKTNPYSILRDKSRSDIRRMLLRLDDMGVIRTDHGIIRISGGFMVTLFRATNDSRISALSGVLNIFLMLMFLPVFFAGIYVCLNSDFLSCEDLTVLENISPIIIVIVVLLSAVVHELAHGVACRAYGGMVFEYGFAVNGFLPCFYTMMDRARIKSRLARVQVLAAGVEGNLFLAGVCLLLTGLFPGMRNILIYAAFINIMAFGLNMLAIKGLDGMYIILELIGLDDPKGLDRLTGLLRSRKKRRAIAGEGIIGHLKLTACVMLGIFMNFYFVIILSEILYIIGGIL